MTVSKVQTIQLNKNNFALSHSTKHTIFIIDVSGSMYGPLNQIRESFTKDLLTRLSPGDQLSVIWFSGRDQFGTVFECETTSTLADTDRLSKTVTKWLQPIGLTGFAGPLKLAMSLANKSPLPTKVVFMSDGMDNQSSKQDIQWASDALSSVIEGAEVIEYGNYADRVMLADIATRLNGIRNKVDSPRQFVSHLVEAMGENAIPLIEVENIPAEYVTVFYSNKDAHFAKVNPDGKVQVPQDAERIAYVTDLSSPQGEKPTLDEQDALYGHLAYLSAKMDGPQVDKTLRLLGDKKLSLLSAKLFGKQRYEEFETLVRAMLNNPSLRYLEGFDPLALPDENAVTVLDILDVVVDGETRLLITDPDFEVQRISRKRHVRTVEEEIEDLKSEIQDPEKLQKALDDLKIRTSANAQKQVVDLSEGVVLHDLVSHKDRANLSFRVRVPMKVKLENVPEGVPEIFETYNFKNYNVLFGGVITMERLPINPSQKAWDALTQLGVVSGEKRDHLVIPLTAFPLTNRAAVKHASAVQLAEISGEISEVLALLKVLKDEYKKLLPPKTSQGLIEQYGEDNAMWLRAVGITDNGFNPPRKSDEGTDAIVVPELLYTVKGLAKLPSIKDVEKKLESKKPLTLAQYLIKAGMDLLDELNQVRRDGSEYVDALISEIDDLNEQLKHLRKKLENIRMAVLLGGAWFHDLPDDGVVRFEKYGYDWEVEISTRDHELHI